MNENMFIEFKNTNSGPLCINYLCILDVTWENPKNIGEEIYLLFKLLAINVSYLNQFPKNTNELPN